LKPAHQARGSKWIAEQDKRASAQSQWEKISREIEKELRKESGRPEADEKTNKITRAEIGMAIGVLGAIL